MILKKEVIVLAFLNGTILTPLLLTYENEAMYLDMNPQGCTLFTTDSVEPFYRIQEPLLLAQGIMTASKTVHLVVLKTSGELCYTQISGSSTPHMRLIAKLDVRITRYRQLSVFARGKIIHIFYTYSHQTIPHLWRIEHRFWDGSSWQSVHLGEIVHPRFYQVNLDSMGNLHLLTMTFQGQYSLLYTNRFNGAFHVWGSPTEALKFSGEVVGMDALLTSDNVHHLFWFIKTKNGKFELHSGLQEDAHKLTSTWHSSFAPLETFDSPPKSIGALDVNGVLWLLAHTDKEVLMKRDGKGWNLFSASPSLHTPLQWVHKGERNSHQTSWFEDQVEQRTPAYSSEIGLIIKNQTKPLPVTFQPTPLEAPPPVPAFYPEQLSSASPTLTTESDLVQLKLNIENSGEDSTFLLQPEEVGVSRLDELSPMNPSETRDHDNLILTLHNLLSKFDQILEVISEKVIQFKLEAPSPTPSEESTQVQANVETFEEIKPIKEALTNLEKENQSLSQALRMMLTKQEENDSSIDRLEFLICQIQADKEAVNHKGGFWNKWFS